MKPNEYQQLALLTEGPPDYEAFGLSRNQRLLHGLLGIQSEAGELADAGKRHLFYKTDLDLVNVMEECGDILWYIAVTLDAAGYTMEDAMERNISKLQSRFPDKFTTADAVGRDHAVEREILAAPAGSSPEFQRLEAEDDEILGVHPDPRCAARFSRSQQQARTPSCTSPDKED